MFYGTGSVMRVTYIICYRVTGSILAFQRMCLVGLTLAPNGAVTTSQVCGWRELRRKPR